MRTINVALNESKLATKRLQLSQLHARVIEATEKLSILKTKFEKKSVEVSQLETGLVEAQTSATVSK